MLAELKMLVSIMLPLCSQWNHINALSVETKAFVDRCVIVKSEQDFDPVAQSDLQIKLKNVKSPCFPLLTNR